MNGEKGQSPDLEMYDTIDRYVLELMEEDERIVFEKAMAADASLAEQVSVRRMVIEEVRRKEALRDDFLTVEAAHPYQADDPADSERHGKPDQHGRRLPAGVRRIMYFVISVAAAACLVSGIFFRYSYVSQGIEVGNDVVLADVIQPSRGDSAVDEIRKAIEDVRYAEAGNLIAAFRSVPAPESDLSTEEGRYLYEQYLADCMAVDYLEAVKFLRQGHPFKAKRILKSIISCDSYYSDQATELLEKL